MTALVDYLLRLGDDRLVLGHRLSEWCGHGPILEEDIALANVALDLIGQAANFLRLAGQLDTRSFITMTNLVIENQGASPMRALLYAAERQETSLVSYGPFIGDTPEDITRSIERYKTGVFRNYASP